MIGRAGADGSSTAIVTATVTDAWGRPVGDGTNVAFNSTLGTISPSVLTVGGVATATLDSSPENELGTAVITATAGGAAGQTSVWFVVGPLAQILVTAQPSELTADGASTALITATLTDGGGHLITETTTVTFSATLGAVFPLTKTTSSGIVTTTLQASDTKGTATIIALVDDISGQTSVAFTDFYIYLPLTIRNGPSS